eukprot:Amastigsp_a350449_7.p3 type:complete len:101 gc:universal Amastigsp_a350449_7:132-434(+)
MSSGFRIWSAWTLSGCNLIARRRSLPSASLSASRMSLRPRNRSTTVLGSCAGGISGADRSRSTIRATVCGACPCGATTSSKYLSPMRNASVCSKHLSSRR